MATVLANNSFTFQVLFVDQNNTPITVTNPIISVFTFSALGVKQTLVNAVPLVPVVPAEVGRYTYTYAVPSVFDVGSMLYGEMSGTDPVSGDLLRVLEEVSVVIKPPGTQGLGSHFC